MSPRDLAKKLSDHPFKPFRICLSDGTSVDVQEPGMIVIGETSAIVPYKIYAR